MFKVVDGSADESKKRRIMHRPLQIDFSFIFKVMVGKEGDDERDEETGKEGKVLIK